MRVLLVEDDQGLGEGLRQLLDDEGYEVTWADHGRDAQRRVRESPPDVVILDLQIPPPAGLELLREWRSAGHSMPVLILTAQDRLEERVTGLDAGADDYMVKPFSFGELLARLRSLGRRKDQALIPELAVGPLRIDRAQQTVTVDGEPLALPAKEFALLEYLLLRKDEVVSRAELSEHVWDDSFDAMTNVIDVKVYRLRKRLEGATQEPLIHTVKGAGYVIRSLPGGS